MIRHIVMFRFRDTAEATRAENTRKAAELLAGLQGHVPTLLTSEVRLNADGAAAGNYDLVLITTHESLEALDAYQKHPAHLAVAAFIGGVREARACVDFEE